MERFWTNNYPKGVDKEIDLTSTDTLNDLFDRVCQKYPNNRALTSHNETLTFLDTEKYVRNLTANLAKLGVKKGDRIAIIMPNLIQYPLSIFAVFKLGAIVVNINPLYTASEIDYLLDNSGAKVIITLDLIANKLNDLYSLPKQILMNFAIKYIKKMKADYNYPAVSYSELLKPIDSFDLTTVDEITPYDLAFIQYTGATTGKPKGVMLSHYNIVANLSQINAWLKPQIPNLESQVAIDALPLYHIFSLTANLLTFFFHGSENVMILNPRDVKDLVKTLVKTPFTIFSALDTLYNHLLNSKEFRTHKYPHFKYSVAGGMPMRNSVAEEWFKLTNVMPSNCYGLSESSPAVTLNPLDNSFDGSVGFPVPELDLEIRDLKTKMVLPPGEIGAIWIKGPQITSGYWQNIEQTKLAIDDNGWLNTHDLGYLTVPGKLFLSGRESEMIIVSGFDVYPTEVEAVLNSFAEIKESAVIGIADEKSGERVVAVVSLKNDGSITPDEIIQRCKKHLAGYKSPHYVYIKNELPKTLVGKIDKNVLKQDNKIKNEVK